MLPEPLRGIPDLWEATYDLVAQVPEGRVTTYGHVARALGDVVASRFVGLAMSMNDDIVRVPCRRVVRSDGSLGGYTGGGPEKKADLLVREGIRVEQGRVMNLDEVLFDDFRTDHPLRALRARQRQLRREIRVPSRAVRVDSVAGVDVAYDGEHAFAALAVFDLGSGELVDSSVVEGEAHFPYVPTYLAFRELPIVAPLMKRVGRKTALMYDGNGLLHPERCGIASQAGVMFNRPSIGVAKSLLCGSRGEETAPGTAPILLEGRVAGYEMSSGSRSGPVYVSVGHGLPASQALDITRMLKTHRVPEPTRAAHMLAGRARRARTHK